jgi:hypothetical protein
MKSIINFKIGVIFSLLFFLSQNILASGFILSDDGLIDPRAQAKINVMGLESKTKLGVNIYVYVKNTYGLGDKTKGKEKIIYLKNHESQILPVLEKPYVLMTMSIIEQHVNLLISKNLKKIIDKDDILDGYVVPLLASKDKNTLYAKVSAATLNGYAAIADTIADSKDIELESSIGSQGKIASTIWRVLMYTLVVIGLLTYTFVILREKRRK